MILMGLGKSGKGNHCGYVTGEEETAVMRKGSASVGEELVPHCGCEAGLAGRWRSSPSHAPSSTLDIASVQARAASTSADAGKGVAGASMCLVHRADCGRGPGDVKADDGHIF